MRLRPSIIISNRGWLMWLMLSQLTFNLTAAQREQTKRMKYDITPNPPPPPQSLKLACQAIGEIDIWWGIKLKLHFLHSLKTINCSLATTARFLHFKKDIVCTVDTHAFVSRRVYMMWCMSEAGTLFSITWIMFTFLVKLLTWTI